MEAEVSAMFEENDSVVRIIQIVQRMSFYFLENIKYLST